MINNEIRDSLKKVIQALNDEGVEYMIIGGVAVASYGYHRVSGVYNSSLPEVKHDIDFWYNPSLSNFTKLVNALKNLGIKRLDGIIFDRQSYLRINHDTFRTEFLPQMTGLSSFDHCFENAKSTKVDGTKVHFISYADLIKNKAQLGRPIDKEDIRQLEQRRSNNKDQPDSI